MLSVYIGTLKIHDSQIPGDFWLETPIEGMDFPETRISMYNKPGENGAVVSAEFYGSRGITLHGFIKGANATIHEADRIAFQNAVSQQKDTNGYPVTTRVTFTTLAGNVYYVDGFFKRPIMNYADINFTRYSIDIVAPNHAIFKLAPSTLTINRAIGGGAIVPFIVPVTLAPSSGGAGTLVNNGSTITFPIIKFIGPLTNPYLANDTVGKFMQLSYSLLAGSTITIDMQNKTIMLNGSTSLLSTKVVGSDWWGLTNGSNNITFSTSSTADTGQVSFTYNDAYLGI